MKHFENGLFLSIAQMGKLRPRAGKDLICGHSASE